MVRRPRATAGHRDARPTPGSAGTAPVCSDGVVRVERRGDGRAAQAVLLAALLVVAACSSGGTDGGSDAAGSASSTTVTEAPGAPGWTQFGHDLANTRLDRDPTAITAESVATLEPDWSLDGVVGVTGTPVVADGVVYVADWQGTVHALDAATGEARWTRELGGSIPGSVPVADDAVFVASGTTLRRLDQATGEIEWEATTHRHPFAMASSSPVVADGLVVQGVASGEVTVPQTDYTFRGSIGAWDAETGERVWRRFLTPGDETGGAGVGIWSTPAVDLERGVVYVGTGNTYEEPTAPLADSLLALDLRTGEVVWSTQFTNPDVFAAGAGGGVDADVGVGPNLWTSEGRDLVGAADKAGTYYALDRDSGDEVWATTLTPGSMLGGAIGGAALVDGVLVVTSNVGNPENNAPTNASKVAALDPADGAVVWERDLEGTVYAPVSAIPGVAFVSTGLGDLLALDTGSGDVLWEFRAPAPVGSGPSIAGDHLLWGYGYTLFGPPGEGGLLSFTPDPGDD